MKTTRLLQALERQLVQLSASVTPLSQHVTLSARFDRHLFQTRSTRMQDYLDEAYRSFAELRHAVEHQQLPQVAWLAEHLAAQIEAMNRETAAWPLRAWDSSSPSLTRWQRKRLQHQEYERRLLAMQKTREQQMAQATTLEEQQRLAKEIDAFTGRLERCRHALRNIENIIARLTR